MSNNMVYVIYTEKRPPHNIEALKVQSDLLDNLNIKWIKNIRIINRYLIENIDEDILEKAKFTIFAEPMTDNILNDIPQDDNFTIFAVEYLPGQYDQRADSCEQCIQILTQNIRPSVRSSKIYIIEKNYLPYDEDIEKIKNYLINPVESRETSLEIPDTLQKNIKIPDKVITLDGFIERTDENLFLYIQELSLSMDKDDMLFCRDYFKNYEKRNPTITEMRVIDTYWSDHCRHTTFLTEIENVSINDNLIKNNFLDYLKLRKFVYNEEEKPVTLMDIATIGAKYLKKSNKLSNLDESDEINACSVKIKVDVSGEEKDWLLMFKNETHNHPTEIEPFGGAATCLGGAIRDPLSGRSFVYQAMRVTGSADPRTPYEKKLEGKLTQKQITVGAAHGYSSYGNQIGLCTGGVYEIYHPDYIAKRLEIGAVVGAAPESNVVRKRPEQGDIIILLGGKTGRDGCGGATGSSKLHTTESISVSGAEVQKGNPIEERKIQRLFRNPEVTALIKRCNDFGAGGISVAIGELADSLLIDLSKVQKKYDGLDGTELAISESQERMAVVVDEINADKFIRFAQTENLEATKVALVTNDNRLRMVWNDMEIVSLDRDFLNSNGAKKYTDIEVDSIYHEDIVHKLLNEFYTKIKSNDLQNTVKNCFSDLNICAQKGLVDMFDSSVGASNILSPFGGKFRLTPSQSMASKIPLPDLDTKTCSVMSYGFSPYISKTSPFHGAMYAVIDSIAKLIASGVNLSDMYLTLQEYFPSTNGDPKRFALPFMALLGALRVQKELEIAAIGGKDSMSGTFNNFDVPPTLVSFAVGTAKTNDIISNEFKKSGNKVYLFKPIYKSDGILNFKDLKKMYEYIHFKIKDEIIVSAHAVGMGGIFESTAKMCFGNGLGFDFCDNFTEEQLFSSLYGAIIVESTEDIQGEYVGTINSTGKINLNHEIFDINKILNIWLSPLEKIFPTDYNKIIEENKIIIPKYEHRERPIDRLRTEIFSKPKVLIIAFPGTNSEYDCAKKFTQAGAISDIFVIKNLTSHDIDESLSQLRQKIDECQILMLPGGFSGGDEPDGSAKFITTIFRNPSISDAVHELINNRDGLILGICNGFQALIKLGLLPFGEIKAVMDKNDANLTFNAIGRHQAGIYYTRIASTNSPWLKGVHVGDIHARPISHGEGRFIADELLITELANNGQIATQYVNLEGIPTMNPFYNPNGSIHAIEGIISRDGRIFGKMGHSERTGDYVFKNVPGNYDQKLFCSGVNYFK